jgi:hypothetical protein
VSAVYNCCWSSPAQSFLVLSTAGLVTIFYSFRFETPSIWRARSPYLFPVGTGWPSYTPRHWFPFRRLLRLAGLGWRYSNPPPRGVDCKRPSLSPINLRQKSRTENTLRKLYPSNSSIVIETAILLLLPAYSFPRGYV